MPQLVSLLQSVTWHALQIMVPRLLFIWVFRTSATSVLLISLCDLTARPLSSHLPLGSPFNYQFQDHGRRGFFLLKFSIPIKHQKVASYHQLQTRTSGQTIFLSFSVTLRYFEPTEKYLLKKKKQKKKPPFCKGGAQQKILDLDLCAVVTFQPIHPGVSLKLPERVSRESPRVLQFQSPEWQIRLYLQFVQQRDFILIQILNIKHSKFYIIL